MFKSRPQYATPRVVSREEWIEARKAHLKNEKALTHMRDMVSESGATCPGSRSTRSMSSTPRPERRRWPSCSATTASLSSITSCGDGISARAARAARCWSTTSTAPISPRDHDVSFVAISRGKLADLEAYWKRMGWKFDFASSYGSDFNFDYHVSFTEADMASGKLSYNYERSTRKTASTSCRAPASSTRTKTATSSTPIRRMRAAATFCSASTIISTSRRRAGTTADHGVGEAPRRVRIPRQQHAFLLPLLNCKLVFETEAHDERMMRCRMLTDF